MGRDGVLVSLAARSIGGAREVLGATAHEVGHVLKLDHTSSNYWHLLMKDHDLQWNNNHLDSTRFQKEDFEIIRKQNRFYEPN